MTTKKVQLLEKLELYEKVEIELSKWSPDFKFSEEVSNIVEIGGKIQTYEERDRFLKFAQELIKNTKEEKTENDGKLYLSELIERDKVSFGSNNLILSPVGSGKTEFIKTQIKENDNILLLVSTTSLKDKMVPLDEKLRKVNADRMYSTKNKKLYGKGSHKILVMTYYEFGERVKFSPRFFYNFNKIFCDEIHSLPLYQSYNDSSALLLAIHYLFLKSNQQKFYFTATDEYVRELKSKSTDLFQDIQEFNYLDHPDIKRYTPLSSYEIDGIEQVRSHLQARKESFHYFGYKIFAFCKTIESELRLKKICEEEGFTAQAYWSKNNEEKEMNEQQIVEVEKMISEEKLPDKYDVVIINSSLQEGWNLKDSRVKLAIINTTNETEYVQSLGRIRNDLDILIYKSKEKKSDKLYINFPPELIEVPLDRNMQEQLRKQFNILTDRGTLIGWPKIKEILENQGFIIVNKQMTIDKKRKKVDIVYSR